MNQIIVRQMAVRTPHSLREPCLPRERIKLNGAPAKPALNERGRSQRPQQDPDERNMKVSQVAIDWRPAMSVYASEPFLRAVGDESGWLAGFDQHGRQRCVLPYTIVRKASIQMARFRVETIPIGDPIGTEDERAFLDGVVAHFRAAGVDLIIPATTNTIFRTYPDGADAAPYGSHILDLTHSQEAIWDRMHSKHRNVIRSAGKKGVQIRTGLDLADKAYELIRATFKRSSLPFMRIEAFRSFVSALGENVAVLTAEADNRIQACAVIPYSEYSAYYAYGGTAPHPPTGAANLLQWHAICHLKAEGVKRYDFCGARTDPEPGSKAAGLVMFKERFGASLHRGFIWKYALNRWKAPLYSAAVRLLRGGDIVDAERHKLSAQGTHQGSPAGGYVGAAVR